MKDENGMLTPDKDNPLTQKGELERLKKENAALGKRLETVNRELAISEAEVCDLLQEIKDRAAERDEALKRVAELEAEDAADVADDPRVLRRALENLAMILASPERGVEKTVELWIDQAREELASET